MTGASRPFRCQAGQVLFRPRDACPGFLTLTRGTIRVSLTSASGREIVLYRVRPGEVCLQTFGCLVEDHPYSAEGVAETDLDGELVPAEAFARRIADDDAFRDRVFTAVARRFADFERLVEDVALSRFEARLARALLRLADADGVVRATHETLAAETGSARAVVSRQLGAFARRGWLTLARGRIALGDAEALARVAAE